MSSSPPPDPDAAELRVALLRRPPPPPPPRGAGGVPGPGAGSPPETPPVPAPMRSFFRCMVSAQARATVRLEGLRDQLLGAAGGPPALDEPAWHRLWAVAHDLVAARAAYARWKTFTSVTWGHLGPATEFRELLALSVKHDLELGALAALLLAALQSLRRAIEAAAAEAAAESAVGP